MTLEDSVLKRITPTDAERDEVKSLVSALESQANGVLESINVPGRAAVQGSIAKDTYLAGDRDVDCFLLLDPSVEIERLESITEAVGEVVLESSQKKYAQHPYLVGTRDGAQVDLVPAYAVASASDKMSAVDRTPFHTAWVAAHLDGAARNHVRLAKQWLKGVGCYGADTATAGFSGYLVEVLIGRFKTFPAFVEWLARSATPRRISLGDDHVDDEVSLLVVVDPVDAARNCAAAVGEDTLLRATQAARTYLADSQEAFFWPAPPRAESAETLNTHLSSHRQTWLGLELTPTTDRLDIVLPQFQKASRMLGDTLQRAGFPVRAVDVRVGHDESGTERVGIQWLLDDVTLPERRLHQGPDAETQPNADRFRKKWETHKDTVGPVHAEAGRLQVEVLVRQRRAHERLAADLPNIPLGKHVKNALKAHNLLHDPADASGFWSPAVADFVLDRRPWQRS